MSDIQPEDLFNGYSHNDYQSSMHKLAHISLWLIVIIGVATGIFGFVYGLGR
ncbi:MAG: hypothetical protein J2O46_07765 [Nocardioides sp.]|nr:hypothetical protein [Nocardioides sp.]